MVAKHKPDSFQEAAITSTGRAIRIVAPAGSGKTETIARRIAHRVSQGVDPARILVLTFDKAGQKSLSRFLRDALGRKVRIDVRTLNSHGQAILKEWYPGEIASTLLDARAPAMTLLMQEFDAHDLPVLTWDGIERHLVHPWASVFSAMKNEGLEPGNPHQNEAERKREFLQSMYLRLPEAGESARLNVAIQGQREPLATSPYERQLQQIIRLYDDYETRCRELDVMEYADQKLRAFFSIWRDPARRDELRDRYDEIIVDECQDLSRLDALLIRATLAERASLFLAGDDDQTLYEFRNAHSLFLRHPTRYFGETAFETIELAKNYRSPQEILEPAVRLIAHNTERIEKSPSSALREFGEVTVIAVTSREEHHERIVALISEELSRGTELQEIAIIVGTDRHQQNALRKALTAAEIPARTGDPTEGTPHVELVSFLKAKGRQWPVVIIPYAEQACLPDSDALRKGELEAARRMMYVAMTRASRRLAVAYLRDGETDRAERDAAGEIISTNGASRFLIEAGLVTPEPEPEPTPEPEPRPQPQSAPAPEPAPASPKKPKRKPLQPWDLRAIEKTRLRKSSECIKKKEYEYACNEAWKAIESVVMRMYGPAVTTIDGRKPTAFEAFQVAERSGRIDPYWISCFHRWRTLRNDVSHTAHDLFAEENEERAICKQMVREAPEFLAHLAGISAPHQMPLQTNDDLVTNILTFSDNIAANRPTAAGQSALSQIVFDPAQAGQAIVLQMALVLRDARFYVPEDFRWTSSEIVRDFLRRHLRGIPDEIEQGLLAARDAPSDEELRTARLRLDAVLAAIAGEADPDELLARAVTQALAVRNGDYHVGFKLVPMPPRG